jgi:hypothetical protein
VLRSSAAIESSLKVVNVVGILDQTHGGQMVMVNGRKEKRCSLLPMMTCEEHFKIADYAFTNGHVGTKGFQQILVNVWNMEGRKPQKPVHNPGGEGYVKIVEDALKKLDGSTVGKLEYDAFMAQMDAAKSLQDKGHLPKAIEILVKAAAHPSPRLAPLADQRVRELNEQGSGRVSEAETQATKDVAKAKMILKEVIRDYAPLDCSQRAAEVLKRLNEKK